MPDNNHKSGLMERMLDLLGPTPNGRVRNSESRENSLYLNLANQIGEFLDEMPNGFLIYRADVDENILYANKALLEIFECDTYEEFYDLVKGSFKGIVYEEDLAMVEESITKQIELSDDNFDYVEYRVRDKKGALKWVEDYGHYVQSNSVGNIYYVFISDATDKVTRMMFETEELKRVHEVTESHRISLIDTYEQDAPISQEHLQRLEVIEGLSINYESILYANVGENMVLPYRLSSRLKKQFNKKLQVRDLQWFLKDYVKVWVHPDDRERVLKYTSVDYMRSQLKNKTNYFVNYRCNQNGKTIYLQLHIVNVSSTDEVSHVVMGYRDISEDITEELQKKQILQEALNKAKLADVAKNTFLSNMSHDMRTPLNAVFGYAALAKKSLDDPETAYGYIEKIEEAGSHILELVDKVLEISYSKSQEVVINTEECDLRELAESALAAVRPMAKRKKIKISLDLSNVSDFKVYADYGKLTQVLGNIASNSIKYTPEGGHANFSVSEQSRPTDEIAIYKFTAKDDGIGMTPEFLERVFEPFEREQNTTFSGEYGTGLGLTICKHFIEMMGGEISAESTLGKGSTFTVTIGLKRVRGKGKPHKSKKGALDPHDMTILLVEDNEINLEIETDLLTDLGFTVEAAENGAIAVEKMTSSAPDAYSFILMDIQMPVMNGIEAAEKIRGLTPDRKDIPIIALSANALESDVRNSMEAGMDAHLKKPLDLDVLLKTIAEIAERKTFD